MYSRPCRKPHAAATYTSPHWTTLRRRSLVQVLSTPRSAGVSVTSKSSVSSSGASFGRAASAARCCAMSRSMSAKIGFELGFVADGLRALDQSRGSSATTNAIRPVPPRGERLWPPTCRPEWRESGCRRMRNRRNPFAASCGSLARSRRAAPSTVHVRRSAAAGRQSRWRGRRSQCPPAASARSETLGTPMRSARARPAGLPHGDRRFGGQTRTRSRAEIPPAPFEHSIPLRRGPRACCSTRPRRRWAVDCPGAFRIASAIAMAERGLFVHVKENECQYAR